MLDPLTSSALAAAVAKHASELAKIGYEKWQANQRAKARLISIVQHVQEEVNRNYNSVRAALDGSIHEEFETSVYDAGIDAIRRALTTEWALLAPLGGAREEMTPGMQARLRLPLAAGEDVEKARSLLRHLGQASYEMSEWLNRQGVYAVGKADCEFRLASELIAGWPKQEQLVLLRCWRAFCDKVARGAARMLGFLELGDVVRGDALAEAELRDLAERTFGPLGYSFELVRGVHELRIDARVRVLFAFVRGGPILLDVVDLPGREADGPTPRRYLERAACRREHIG